MHHCLNKKLKRGTYYLTGSIVVFAPAHGHNRHMIALSSESHLKSLSSKIKRGACSIKVLENVLISLATKTITVSQMDFSVNASLFEVRTRDCTKDLESIN